LGLRRQCCVIYFVRDLGLQYYLKAFVRCT
jgi:hypothetical protein